MSKTRFNWDVFPSTKLEEKSMVSPVGCMFTPFDSIVEEVSESHPLRCTSCLAIINQFIRLDRENGNWWCPFCFSKTRIPETFELPQKGCSDDLIPAPIRPTSHGTVDYIIPHDISQAKMKGLFVIYVIDTYNYSDHSDNNQDCLDDFVSLKEAISKSIENLPKDYEVLIVTFSDSIILHKPSSRAIEVLQTHNTIEEDQNMPQSNTRHDLSFYLEKVKKVFERLPKSEICSKPSPELIEYVMNLTPHFTSKLKPPRATGLSVLATCQLISEIFPTSYLGKVSLFLTGPGTLEPGKIVDELGTLRSHRDILELQAPYLISSQQFYKIFAFFSAGYPMSASIKAACTLASPLLFSVPREATKFTFDIYSGSINQVGIYEMKVLAEAGNGSLFMDESFASKRFADTLKSNILLFIGGNSNCILTVLPSSGLKVSSIVANCTALQSSFQLAKDLHLHDDRISDIVTKYDSPLKKKYFTNKWYMGSTNKADTFGVFFEVETVSSSDKLDKEKGRQEVLVQFQVSYYDSLKKRNILKVTTVRRPTTLAFIAQPKPVNARVASKGLHSKIIRDTRLSESFNAIEWVVLFTRLLVNKMDASGGHEPIEEVLEGTVKAIIRLLNNFGGIKVFKKAGENPFEELSLQYSVSENFKKLLPYAYNLCRNPQLTRVFNSSPDETAFYHHQFKALNIDESSVMITPVLYVLKLGYLKEVPLSWASLNANKNESQYFVMDSLSQVVIFKSITKSEDSLILHPSKNDNLLSDASLNEEIKTSMQIIQEQIVSTRKVIPSIVLTQTGHSQARFIQARLDVLPRSVSQTSQPKRKSWWPFGSNNSRPSRRLTDEMPADEFYELLVKKVKAIRLDSI